MRYYFPLFILMLLFCGSTSVFGEEIHISSLNTGNGTVSVSGSLDRQSNLTAAIYKSDDGTIAAENIVYINHFSSVTDESNNFELELKTALSALDDGIYFLKIGGNTIQTALTIQLVKHEDDIYYMLGDIDNDSQITAADSALVLQYVIDMGGYPFSERQLKAARVTGNSVITAENAAVILQKALDNGYVFPVAR